MKIYQKGIRIDGDIGTATKPLISSESIEYCPSSPSDDAVRYEMSITEILRKIEETKSGKCLTEQIKICDYTITIIPRETTTKNAITGVTYEGENVSPTVSSKRYIKASSIGMDFCVPPIKCGTGENMYVQYSKAAWPRTNERSPGGGYSQVLYHELVHALRGLKGTFELKKRNDDFENFDDFCAILATNIYSSERKWDLRKGHIGFTLLDLNEKDFFEKYKTDLLRFQAQSPGFANGLATIVCGFNPLRILVESQKKAKKEKAKK